MQYPFVGPGLAAIDGDLTSELVRENTELRRQLATLRAYGGESQLELLEENQRLKREIAGLRALSHLAFNDPLTGLRNRRYFDERLRQELSRARREAEPCLSVVFCDVDDLKEINDRHGHVRGDEVLRWVANIVRKNLREHDVCCRLGGDEFAVILPQAGMEGCRKMVARLRAALVLANQERDIPVSLSLGTATATREALDQEALVAAADAEMYQNKLQYKQARRAAG
jgi:diguanylate cyclase (GGDEF)-like protein